MRLINVHTFQVLTHFGSNVPQYAILSHVWGDHEVSLEDLQLRQKELAQFTIPEFPLSDANDGRIKIGYVCRQAAKDGLDWAWIDTCCIDKSSSAELSEAINSMFKYYQNARVCYAYLPDVWYLGDSEMLFWEFRKSKWFTRGWTLQELLAPITLRFYGREWKLIGTTPELETHIEQATGIEARYLQKTFSPLMFREASVATRMCWASRRQTTRLEDQAYCLLGIFDVNMPMLYGEGTKAFLRLQEEIMKQSDDETILAWGMVSTSYGWKARSMVPFEHGFLATSPAAFKHCLGLMPWPGGNGGGTTFSITSRGLLINVPVAHIADDRYDAILRCNTGLNDNMVVGLPLLKLETGNQSPGDAPRFSRIDRPPASYYKEDYREIPSRTVICISQKPWWPRSVMGPSWTEGFYIRRLPDGCHIDFVQPPREWSPPDRVISIHGERKKPRLLYGTYQDIHFIIRLVYIEGDWECDIALRQRPRNPPPIEEELRQLDFDTKAVIRGAETTITMRKQRVFGRKLMVVDVDKHEPANPLLKYGQLMVNKDVLEFGYVLVGVSMAMAAFVLGPQVMARRRHQ